jgi:Arc/MetJ-type ribon-helix-helix transcriptional regulator
MPRVFEPLIEKSGPLGKKKKGCIRRRRSGKTIRDLLPSIASFGEAPEELPTTDRAKQSKTSKFIGEDLLEWSGKKVERSNEKNCEQNRVSKKKRSNEAARVSTEEIARARKKYLTSSRHALALDTRISDLPSTTLSITDHFQEFLRTLVVRGAPPCILSVTIPDRHKKSRLALGTTESGSTKTIAFASGVGIQTRILSQDEEMNNIVPVVIPANKTQDSIVVAVPNALTAEHSWTLLSEIG